MTGGRRPRLLCLTGTTGSGKNAIGARVAAEIGGEIISLDSMKVYRGMDIGTAKPSERDRRGVPHHLIDILEPCERMDLQLYLDRAEACIGELEGKGRHSICVGGTQMYLTGLLYGVYDGPSRDDALREELRTVRDREGSARLHERLASVDPESAQRLNPNDYQRIERALEVHALTGRRPSELRTGWYDREPRYDAKIYAITWPRDVLRRRIEHRITAMMASGWIDEVRAIRDGVGFSREASMALGYREILAYLDDALAVDELERVIATRTWRFSRRQMTWLNKYPDAEIIVREDESDASEIAARIAREWRTPA